MNRKKLSRSTNARKHLFATVASELILHEKVVTTYPKARVVKRIIEKLVTLAKTKTVSHRRLIEARLLNSKATAKLVSDIAPRFTSRQGGYVRMVRMGTVRRGDASVQSVLFWTVPGVKKVEEQKVEKPKKVEKTKKTTVKEKKVARKK